MRKYKKGESVTVRMLDESEVLPDESGITGTILRLSPDGKACVLRIDDDLEMLIETRFLHDEPTANT